MSYVPSIAVLSHHFEKKRAIAMSIVTAGAPIGAAGYSILLDNLLSGDLGFANSIRIVAATNAVLLLVGCALMRTGSLCPKTQVHYSQLLRTSSSDCPYICATIGCAANNAVSPATILIPLSGCFSLVPGHFFPCSTSSSTRPYMNWAKSSLSTRSGKSCYECYVLTSYLRI